MDCNCPCAGSVRHRRCCQLGHRCPDLLGVRNTDRFPGPLHVRYFPGRYHDHFRAAGCCGHRRSVPGVPHGHQHQHPSAAQGVENSGAGDPVDGRGNGISVCSDPAGWLGCCCGYHPDRKRRYRCHQPDGGCCSGQGRYHGCGPGYPGLWRTEVCGHYSRF